VDWQDDYSQVPTASSVAARTAAYPRKDTRLPPLPPDEEKNRVFTRKPHGFLLRLVPPIPRIPVASGRSRADTERRLSACSLTTQAARVDFFLLLAFLCVQYCFQGVAVCYAVLFWPFALSSSSFERDGVLLAEMG
jgi:hypothetical protein